MDSAIEPQPAHTVRGVTAVGIFLAFGAVMASLAGFTLVWRGTALDRMWSLNPRAYLELTPFGRFVGVAFLLLAFTLAVTCFGWFRRRLWAWCLAVAVFATQVLGDLVNALRGHLVEGGIGVAIAGSLLVYLLRGDVRAVFAGRRGS